MMWPVGTRVSLISRDTTHGTIVGHAAQTYNRGRTTEKVETHYLVELRKGSFLVDYPNTFVSILVVHPDNIQIE